MRQKKQYFIPKTKEGMSVGQFLQKEAGFTKAQIRSMKFAEEGICLNGKQARVTAILKEKDQLEILLKTKEKDSSHLLSFEKMPEKLYEDEDVIVLAKPAGIAVHPAHGHYQDTLSNQLAYYFRESGQQVEIHSIGRLDLETSGVMLFAKHRAAAARLSEQRQNGELKKEYLALCSGVFQEKEGKICKAIAPEKDSLMKMCVSETGKNAVTHYCVKKQFADAAWVSFWLETGRTHQIRVHMADFGHPLFGDRLYASDEEKEKEQKPSIQRAALHAVKITFLQPFTKKTITAVAELPEDIKKAIDICERQAKESKNF